MGGITPRGAAWFLATSLAAVAVLGQTKSPVAAAAPSKASSRTTSRFSRVGVATWYGRGFQGHKTASGEAFNMFALTAAHSRLPFGSHVRVTNLRTRKHVVVRINDRPRRSRAVIDLSYGAARILQITSRGLTRVRIDLLEAVSSSEMAGSALH